jgi:hypothetical protein
VDLLKLLITQHEFWSDASCPSGRKSRQQIKPVIRIGDASHKVLCFLRLHNAGKGKFQSPSPATLQPFGANLKILETSLSFKARSPPLSAWIPTSKM